MGVYLDENGEPVGDQNAATAGISNTQLRQAINDAAMARLGRNATEDELATYVPASGRISQAQYDDLLNAAHKGIERQAQYDATQANKFQKNTIGTPSLTKPGDPNQRPNAGPGPTPGPGGLDPSRYNDFLDFWDAWDGLDIGAAASAWTAAHPNDPATAIGHSGDAVSYRGQDWDGITNVGSPNQSKVRLFNPTPGGGGAGGGSGAGSGSASSGSFNYPAFTGKLSLDPYQAPAPFVDPGPATDQNDAGYTARLQAAQKALETSAAHRGTLLGPGTLKSLQRQASDYNASETRDLFGRELTKYQLNADQSYQTYQTQQQQKINQFQNDYGVYSGDASRALSGAQFGLASNQANFGNQFSLAQLGLSAANADQTHQDNLLGLILQAYGKGTGATSTGTSNSADALSAGNVANANIWGGTNSNISNLFANYYGNRTNPYSTGYGS